MLRHEALAQAQAEFTNVYDLLEARGYLAQANDPEGIRDYLAQPGAIYYIGFDPTADSLHIGHFIQVIITMWMQAYGHQAIFVAGGGTGLIGDPSGRQDLRKVLSEAQVEHNIDCFRAQFEVLLDQDQLRVLNNADWLREIKYIDYLREIGPHFTINRMLAAECYKSRLDIGLTFLEFNYMTMQAYDFLKLYRDYRCRLQFGGDDQWSNVLAGADLIRRVEGGEAYAQTFALLTTSDGKKMGKTAAGAIWLDPSKTSPFEMYQYLRNIEDASVIKLMKILTLMPLAEIAEYERLTGSAVNEAKIKLAMACTSLVHGPEAAEAARQQAEALFHGAGSAEGMECHKLSREEREQSLLDVLTAIGFIPSKSEGRRLIKQGGLYVGEEAVTDFNLPTAALDFSQGPVVIRRGKKNHIRLEI